MLNMQKLEHKLFTLFVIALVCLTAGISFGLESGELRLEGKHIECLVLRRKDGPTQRFDNPGETVRLPIGEYRIQDIRLKGGYNYSHIRTSTYNWVTVTKDKQAALKVGAPLKQTVKIERQGPVLVLDYELIGVGGETYAGMRNIRPMFTIFKGEKKVGGGQFEFG